MVLSGIVAVVGAAVVSLLPVPYAVMGPGPVLNTLGDVGGKPLIVIGGSTKDYPDNSGTLDLTTVSLSGGPGNRVTLEQALSGWLDPTEAVLPETALFPKHTTAQQQAQENKAEMDDSQQEATAAALRALGYKLGIKVVVSEVEAKYPASAVLQVDDVITSVGGRPTGDADTLRDAVRASVLRPVVAGERVAVKVVRDGRTMDLQVPISVVDKQPIFGIVVRNDFVFPVPVVFQIKNIGGPSAGMMFALSIIDRLTPGSMTGGKKIAGTGEIVVDGQVGPIGGIRQKMVGARRAGADYFLAPADNCDEVVGHIPSGLRVFEVSTLTQARETVDRIAVGALDGLPTCHASSAGH